MSVTVTATVRAPATSANLGPGFDTLGLALDLRDDVTATLSAGPTKVTVVGQGAGELPTDDSHLVVRAMHAAFDALGMAPPAVQVWCHNRIPQARGLGSSSAAIVAGILLARTLAPAAAPPGARLGALDDPAVLRLAAELEGHPDNVAPCLLGGLTIAWRGSDGARAVRLVPLAAVRPVVFVPAQPGLTMQARAALPASVPHADAAHAAGRTALLVHALTHDPALLWEATEDRLHQDYRAPAMPQTAALMAALRQAGTAAVVSGAGPSVLALSSVPTDFHPPVPVLRCELTVDLAGAVVVAG